MTFVTTHLSYYSVMYFIAEDSGEGFPTEYIMAAVIAAIMIAAAVFVIRRKA